MKLPHPFLRLAVLLLLLVPSLPVWGAAKYRVLHNFGASGDGEVPSGPLALDAAGDLYGVTNGGPGYYGTGVVFVLAPSTNGHWKETLLHEFSGNATSPWGSLAFDAAGNLYGTLLGQGSGVFELSPGSGGWNFSVPYSDGAGPGVLIDSLGNLYGDMGPGRYKYYGAIAELSPSSGGWTYNALYSFCGQYKCPDGYDLAPAPIWDGKGNMFGATLYGGVGQPACWIAFGCGVVFEMTPNGDGTWTYTVLHRFLETYLKDGQTPDGGLAMDASGNLYGVTVYGGAHDTGMVFKLTNSGGHWNETVLYDFPDCSVGCLPGGTLVFDKAGSLYGEASGGLGDCGETCGVVFKMSPHKGGKWKYGVLHKFTGKDGGFPGYGLIIDDKGSLFGVTTSFGKYGYGVAFKITP